MATQLSLSLHQLENYAQVLGTAVIQDVADVQYTLHHKMVEWCLNHQGVVVLENGDILSANPAGNDVYECQRHLAHHGLVCGDIFPATDNVINALLNKATHSNVDTAATIISESHQQLRALILSAVKAGASDVHMTILPAQQQTIVKFRVNGTMQVYARWTDKVGIKVHSVAYNHLSTNKQDAFSMVLPQDMSFTESFDNLGDIRIRSSNIGIKNGGCKIVYRLLSVGKDKAPDLMSLGYHPQHVQMLDEVRVMNNGIVLFCGETGSGKTTSLASVLSGVDPRKSCYSIEDPVEKYIDNVDQCPVDTRNSKRNFAYYLRALLRADPDVIMVGEIRDSETAKVSIQGALTGHLILSTLHTRYAVNAVMRLHEQGVPANHLATPGLLRLLVAQQLYPVLCPDCARPLNTAEKAQVQFLYQDHELDKLRTSQHDRHCPTCHGSGIAGRKVYAEMIKVDRKSREFIAKMDIQGWESYLKANGFMGLDDFVRADLLKGKIDAFALKAMEMPEELQHQYCFEV